MIEIERDKVTEPGQSHEVWYIIFFHYTYFFSHLDGRMIEIERDKVTEPGQSHEVWLRV